MSGLGRSMRERGGFIKGFYFSVISIYAYAI